MPLRHRLEWLIYMGTSFSKQVSCTISTKLMSSSIIRVIHQAETFLMGQMPWAHMLHTSNSIIASAIDHLDLAWKLTTSSFLLQFLQLRIKKKNVSSQLSYREDIYVMLLALITYKGEKKKKKTWPAIHGFLFPSCFPTFPPVKVYLGYSV